MVNYFHWNKHMPEQKMTVPELKENDIINLKIVI